MTAIIAAAVVYVVVVSNQVSTGREHLAQLSTQLVQSEQQAATLKPYADFVTATTTRRDAVAGVAKTRFKWDRTLTELAKVGPDGVWLTSVTGTLPAATPSAAVPAAGAVPAVPAPPTIALSGCATHERGVPAYIDRLQLLTGVTEVGFSRSERLGKKSAAASASPASAASGVDCRGSDTKAAQFDLTTTFKSPPALPAAGPQTTGTTNAAAVAAVATPPTAAAPTTQTAAATTGGSR
jgi:Tfp pilus assembly protein PilN